RGVPSAGEVAMVRGPLAGGRRFWRLANARHEGAADGHRRRDRRQKSNHRSHGVVVLIASATRTEGPARSTPMRRMIPTIFVVFVMTAALPARQAAHKFSLDDFSRVARVADPQFSP